MSRIHRPTPQQDGLEATPDRDEASSAAQGGDSEFALGAGNSTSMDDQAWQGLVDRRPAPLDSAPPPVFSMI